MARENKKKQFYAMLNVSFCIRFVFRRGLMMFSETREVQLRAIARPNCDVIPPKYFIAHEREK